MQAEKIYTKKFRFYDKTQNEELIVIIPEVLDPNYGFYIWPCAPVLAQYVWFFREEIKRKHILELSAGTALPGIVASKCNAASVTLSEHILSPNCLKHCANCCATNSLDNLPVIGITWGLFSPELISLPPMDIILVSDCFYDSKDFDDIFVTLSYILEKNDKCEIWCTYQIRSTDKSLAYHLEQWNLTCVYIPLSSFEANGPCVADSNYPGNHTIEMLKIFRKNT